MSALYQLSYLALCWRCPYFVHLFVRGCQSEAIQGVARDHTQIKIQPGKRQPGDHLKGMRLFVFATFCFRYQYLSYHILYRFTLSDGCLKITISGYLLFLFIVGLKWRQQTSCFICSCERMQM